MKAKYLIFKAFLMPVILAVFGLGIAVADIIQVPLNHATIQEAIDAAVDGDTVLVAPGTYVENIDFLGKAITVASEAGPEETIIDGNQSGSAVTFVLGEGLTSVLSGFTVQNGNATFGAGVTLLGSSPTIIGNIFDSNNQGGGGFGAGIGGNNSSPTIEQNVFRNNTCDDQWTSGVVSFVNGSSPLIVNNIFESNPCRAINMTIPVGYQPKIINNTMVMNRVGVRVDRRVNTSFQTYLNNIIAGNDIGLEVDFGSEDYNPTWGSNLVFGNGIDYDVIADQTGISGNISADPLFLDAANSDFHLLPDSPALDAGDNTAPGLPATDQDGNPRIVNGIVDMGALEAEAIPKPACDNDGVCEAGEDCNNCPNDCRQKTKGSPKSQYCCDGDLPECGDARCSESGWFCTVSGGICISDPECDDGQFCNGAETCSAGSCQSGSDPCPGQGCDEDSDQCVTWECGGNKASCNSYSDCCSGSCKNGTCRGNYSTAHHRWVKNIW